MTETLELPPVTSFRQVSVPDEEVGSRQTRSSSGEAPDALSASHHGRVPAVYEWSEPGMSSTASFVAAVSRYNELLTLLMYELASGATATRANPVALIYDFSRDALAGTSFAAPQALYTDAPTKVYELRRVAGLSWEQLAGALGVSRRTLHNWSVGKEISASNERRLALVLATVKYIDRGSAAENRSLLHSPTPDGATVIDLISDQRFDELRELVGRGPGRKGHEGPQVGERVRRNLAPEPFGEALDRAVTAPGHRADSQDGIVRDSRKPRRARLVVRSRGDRT